MYIHGKGGSALEAEHYKNLFTDCDVYGLDYQMFTPWETKPEIQAEAARLKRTYKDVILVANSIGAFFSMNAGIDTYLKKAYFISPIVNMEKLICDMMKWAGITEAELSERKEIPTPFGETLSWDYLCYVRNNPVVFRTPADILYGRLDHMTSHETVAAFAEQTGASLTVMEHGEHWFHTDEQMDFLDNWILGMEKKAKDTGM